MKKEILYDDEGKEFYSVELKSSGWLFSRWSGEITESKVRQGSECLAKFVAASSCQYVVNDNRKLSGSWLSSIDWIEKELTPKLSNSGVRYIAHILSPEFITKFSAIELEARRLNFRFKLFVDLHDGEQWIKSIMV